MEESWILSDVVAYGQRVHWTKCKGGRLVLKFVVLGVLPHYWNIYDMPSLSTPKARLKVVMYMICEFSFLTLKCVYSGHFVVFHGHSYAQMHFSENILSVKISYHLSNIPSMAGNLKRKLRDIETFCILMY